MSTSATTAPGTRPPFLRLMSPPPCASPGFPRTGGRALLRPPPRLLLIRRSFRVNECSVADSADGHAPGDVHARIRCIRADRSGVDRRLEVRAQVGVGAAMRCIADLTARTTFNRARSAIDPAWRERPPSPSARLSSCVMKSISSRRRPTSSSVPQASAVSIASRSSATRARYARRASASSSSPASPDAIAWAV